MPIIVCRSCNFERHLEISSTIVQVVKSLYQKNTFKKKNWISHMEPQNGHI